MDRYQIFHSLTPLREDIYGFQYMPLWYSERWKRAGVDTSHLDVLNKDMRVSFGDMLYHQGRDVAYGIRCCAISLARLKVAGGLD